SAAINTQLDDLFKNAPPKVVAKPVVANPIPTKVAVPEKTKEEAEVKKTEVKNPGEKKQRKEKKRKHAQIEDNQKDDIRTAKSRRARQVGYGLDAEEEELEDAEAAKAKRESLKKKQLLGRMPRDTEVVARTVFFGNLTVAAITDKKVYNEFRALCQQFGKLTSVRFRSISFSDMLPRKIAFIQGKFHSDRQVCNAYVEFAEKEAVEKCVTMNGNIFHDHHLRVDMASNEKTHDMKRSVFVGNLDFEAEEEELWRHFGGCGAVENVRVVRDAKTNLGKGFAYVQFVDRASVDLALKLEGSTLGKRKLRVKRGSEKAIKETKRANDKAAAKATMAKAKHGKGKNVGAPVAGVFEGTRSAKGDKPSTKKRRTVRSKAFAEKRLNTEKSAGAKGAPKKADAKKDGFKKRSSNTRK
ncbi:Nucleolar protein 12, partial [Linderina macrospora]